MPTMPTLCLFSFASSFSVFLSTQATAEILDITETVFVLHADRVIGGVVLPQRHCVVEFVVPTALFPSGYPDLRKPIAQVSSGSIAMQNTSKIMLRPKVPQQPALARPRRDAEAVRREFEV